SIVQRGHKVKATITQDGFNNTASVDQRGTGAAFNEAEITQRGSEQYASVNQNGYDRQARVPQNAWGNVALVDLTGHGHTAPGAQTGTFNFAARRRPLRNRSHIARGSRQASPISVRMPLTIL